MAQEIPLSRIEVFLNQYINQWPDIFVVDIAISATNKITVLIDGDNGITIEKCAAANRALYKFIEGENLFNGQNFSMEVSSPGIDRPLKLNRQYKKNIGRTIEVVKKDSTRETGKLLKANDREIVMEKEIKHNKKQTAKTEITILLEDISQVKVLVTF